MKPVELWGPGRVGRAVLRRLARRGWPVQAVVARDGLCYQDAAWDGPGALVDCRPPAYGSGAEAAIDSLQAALRAGRDVVTCNKAPLALAWSRLHEAADEGGTVLRASGTVGGGTPVLPVVERLAATADLAAIEASASGTLAFVCDAVVAGSSLTEAVADAQRLGYAEPDPSLDLDGTDLAAKAVILHNTAFPTRAPIALDEVPRLWLHAGRIRGVAADGTPRAVATIRPGSVRIDLRPAPWAVGDGPCHCAVRIHTQAGAAFVVGGPGAGVDATADNVLADITTLGPRRAGAAPAPPRLERWPSAHG